MSRPTEYEPAYCEQAHNLCASGATDFEVAESLGVHVSTLYRWQHQFPEFREALKGGKEVCDERVVRSLYHRAVGYSYNAVKINVNQAGTFITPYVEHVPPDVGAATLWLTNRQSKDWKNKRDTTLSDPNGDPVSIAVNFIANRTG
jgi:hypothetical protein